MKNQFKNKTWFSIFQLQDVYKIILKKLFKNYNKSDYF